MTGSWAETLFTNRADHTALASSASEGSLLAGTNMQPYLPADYFLGHGDTGRGVKLLFRGVFSTAGTPTLTFQVRMGTTVASTYLSGTSVGASAAITTSSGVSNKFWELELDLICNTPGQGGTNMTLSGSGRVLSPGGFASPFAYALSPGGGESATWTCTLDGTLRQWVNLSATWSASSASNTITCKQAVLFGYFA